MPKRSASLRIGNPLRFINSSGLAITTSAAQQQPAQDRYVVTTSDLGAATGAVRSLESNRLAYWGTISNDVQETTRSSTKREEYKRHHSLRGAYPHPFCQRHVFYDAARGCAVYEERPRQCRSWPFWRAVVHSEERWQEEAHGCPGMNRGRLHGAPEIAESARNDGTSGVLGD